MLPDLAGHQSCSADDLHVYADVLHLYELTGKFHDPCIRTFNLHYLDNINVT
jgi:hypothetical protein